VGLDEFPVLRRQQAQACHGLLPLVGGERYAEGLAEIDALVGRFLRSLHTLHFLEKGVADGRPVVRGRLRLRPIVGERRLDDSQLRCTIQVAVSNQPGVARVPSDEHSHGSRHEPERFFCHRLLR
jgi:hypothetical protein